MTYICFKVLYKYGSVASVHIGPFFNKRENHKYVNKLERKLMTNVSKVCCWTFGPCDLKITVGIEKCQGIINMLALLVSI